MTGHVVFQLTEINIVGRLLTCGFNLQTTASGYGFGYGAVYPCRRFLEFGKDIQNTAMSNKVFFNDFLENVVFILFQRYPPPWRLVKTNYTFACLACQACQKSASKLLLTNLVTFARIIDLLTSAPINDNIKEVFPALG